MDTDLLILLLCIFAPTQSMFSDCFLHNIDIKLLDDMKRKKKNKKQNISQITLTGPK